MNFKSDTYPPVTYSGDLSTRIMACLEIIKDKITYTKCVCCGKELSFDHADIYDHDGGWLLTTLIPKQWISFHCDHCGYDNSVNKLIKE